MENFSTKYIEERINKLLSSVKEVKKINKLNVEGKGNNISIELDFEAKKLFKITGNIKAKLESNNGEIQIKGTPKIEASSTDEFAIRKLLVPKLGKINELFYFFHLL